ncbi:small multi-drug export protein [Oribacterium sp. C9]|uniref:COG2426 family protein n=1 Tax=Oribacterium sp. C9 TaxID=1943579 RepID=UPI00098F3E0C|nr:small multi-drug export protein [Oribacterium sp. C9]OON85517.1 small multi-drug export protein [Oribacterium sp. C9]
MEGLVNLLTENMRGVLSRESVVFIISMMPILELRGGLLAASLLDVAYLKALGICIVGNLLPIPFVLLFIERIILFLEKFGPTKKIAMLLRRKVEKKQASIEKYDFWGLTLFVGIPLPGTGAWTGSLVAGLLHIPLKKSVPAILTGILMASFIMSIVSYGVLGNIVG